jgi:hypothetical protein
VRSRPDTIDGCTVLARAGAVVLLIAPSGVLKTAILVDGTPRKVHTHTQRSAAHDDFKYRSLKGE